VENYKEFFYALAGLAGESQNFDGNGYYVRFQTGGGTQAVSTGTATGGAAPLVGNTVKVPIGTRPRFPGKRPPYQPEATCHRQQRPNLNGPAAAKGPADGSAAPTATAARAARTR
jgi:hypothetical protein